MGERKRNEQVIRALGWAAPLCLAVRYGSLNHCVEASVSGAEVLRREGIQAEPLACRVRVEVAGRAGLLLFIGTTPRQLFEQRDRSGVVFQDSEGLAFEEWQKRQGVDIFGDLSNPFHEAIMVRTGPTRSVLDLSLGQLRSLSGPDLDALPLTTLIPSHGWPEFRAAAVSGPFSVIYEPSLHDAQAQANWNAKVASYSNPGLVGDLHDMVKLALHCGMNADVFFDELARQSPGLLEIARSVVEVAIKRIDRPP